MKNSTLKNTFAYFLGIMVLALFVTSCTTSTEIDEIILPPQSINYTSEITDDPTANNDIGDDRSSCSFCSNMGASGRTSTSSYVYCYGNSGYKKTYRLGEEIGNRIVEIDRKTTYGYYTWFGNLTPGNKYLYNVIIYCPTHTISNRKWRSFTN